jgi:D-alanyl-D-alanine carboxypeptidase/D-alanyl-D-alanine-endopeptidase (penicillin-binding protein 4)
VTDPERPPLASALRFIFLLSGWAVAVVLGLRLVEKPEPPRVVPVVQVAVTPPPSTPVPERKVERLFREWSSHPQQAGALVGFCVLDENGQPVFASPLAGTALCPASALKTVTTGAAFGLLGPEHRFYTVIAGTAPLTPAGVLEGDLVLIGGGDPTFEQDDLDKLADTVIAAGLKRVTGRLRVDTSVFPPDPMSDHWNWGDIGNAYGAGAFGLNLDHNRLEATFEPGAQLGAPAKLLGGGPVVRETRWENYVTTGAAGSGDGVAIYSAPYGRTVTLRGTVPAGESDFTVSGAIPDPPALAVELLRARLEKAGVKFGDRPGPFTITGKTILATHQSAPLPEIIDHLHEVSDNLEAQCFFHAIGLQQGAASAEAIRQYWEKAGVTFTGLRLLDGSGLARANMISPLDLARVNYAARHGPNGQRFFDSLSVYANGAERGKIGGMSGVKTKVGFLKTRSGREFTYAIMGNGLPVDRAYWGRQAELLAQVAAEY